MPKRVSPEDRVIRVSIGLPQRVLDALDDVLDEYNALAEKTGDETINRSQFIGKSLTESYGDPSVVEFLKLQLGLVQTKLDFKQREKKGKK